ncbi:MAG: ribokinase [Clostridia bacterium]|nr:ribokinase [Clostridia bacterium]
MKVLNFGSCNLDLVYRVDHLTRPGETQASLSVETFPGGKGLNQSIALARAGAEVYHAGCIGEDGAWLRDLLRENGVDTSFLQTVPGKTGHALIQVDTAGANCILLFGGANRAVTEDAARGVLRFFDPGDAVVLQNAISEVPAIVRSARERGLRIFYNPSPLDDDALKPDLDEIDCILVNETEAAGLSGSGEPEGFAAWLRQNHPDLTAVLTLGPKGCVYVDKERTLSQPAFSFPVVDTTAAGDTFTGYFVAAVMENKPVEEALRLASAASSMAVSRPGAAPSIPTLAEVSEILPALREID